MKNLLKFTLIGFFWILVWYILALIIDLPLIFPSPLSVIIRLGELLTKWGFYKIALLSFVRIIIGIFIAVCGGCFMAFICSLSKIIYDFFIPLVSIIKSTPVVAFVFLVNLFIGSEKTVIFICFLMVFPIVFANVYQGIKSTDKDLLEMCKLYKIPLLKRASSLYLPSVTPFFISSLLTSIGLAWKAGIAAEILCTPTISIGYEIFNAKQYIEYIDLFAWIVTVVILSMLFELITSKILKVVLSKKHIKTEGWYENYRS